MLLHGNLCEGSFTGSQDKGSPGKLRASVCGKSLCVGRHKPYQWSRLFRIRADAVRNLWLFTSESGGRPVCNRYADPHKLGRTGRPDFLCKERICLPCKYVHRKRPGHPRGRQIPGDYCQRHQRKRSVGHQADTGLKCREELLLCGENTSVRTGVIRFRKISRRCFWFLFTCSRYI